MAPCHHFQIHVVLNLKSSLNKEISKNSWNSELREFENDGMKRHSTLVSLIFNLNCISKTSAIRIIIIIIIIMINLLVVSINMAFQPTLQMN